MGMKPPAYKFEAGGGMPPKPKDENVQVNAAKFKVKSGGGAGFSSGPANAPSTDGPSLYEPGSAQRRTPRRTLGNIINKNAM